MAAAQAFKDDLHESIAKLLRQNFPFTKTSIITKAANVATRGAIQTANHLKQADAVNGVRAIELMDLSAEPRERIFGYAVMDCKPIKLDATSCDSPHQSRQHWDVDTVFQPAVTNQLVTKMVPSGRRVPVASNPEKYLYSDLEVTAKWVKMIPSRNT